MEEKEAKLRPPIIGEAPWLVYTHGRSRHKQTQTFWNVFLSSSPPNNPNTLYIKSIPELRGKSIRATCHGWLILRDHLNKKLVSMWNPITLQSLLLPPLPIEEELLTCLLTSPPDSNDCVLFMFFRGQVFSCHPRMNSTCSWVTQRIELDGHNAEISLAVTINGIIYGMAGIRDPIDDGVPHYMVRMGFADDAANSLTLESFQLRDPTCTFCWIIYISGLVECCGHVYFVGIYSRHAWDNRIFEVKVWELELLGKTNSCKWVEIKSLDGRALFVGKDCCTWCWGTNSTTESSFSSGGRFIHGNCVYFVSPFDDDILYSYSLDENYLTVHRCCLDLQTPFSLPVWINVMPQHHQNLLAVQDVGGQESMTQTKKNFNGNTVDNHGTISNSSNTELREWPQTQFTDLPMEMEQLISEHMHVFDYWNFRSSCKTYQSIVPPTYQRRAESFVPLFVYFRSDYGSCEVMDPCRGDSHSQILHLPPNPTVVDFSKDGWLILSNFVADSLEFCNPLIRIRGAFPTIDDIHGIYAIRSIGFSTYPTSPDCLTIAFPLAFEAVTIYYLQHGNDTWTRCDFYPENDDFEFRVGTSSPVYFAGAFYVLDNKEGDLGAFELVDGEGRWKVHKKPPFDHETNIHSSHLVECDEHLVAVFVGHMGKWIQVFQFDHIEKEWIKIKSLGNHSLFIGRTSSFSAIMKQGMGDRIYMSRLKEKSLIYYSLNTGNYHVSSSEDLIQDFNDTTEPLYSCWI